MVEVRQGRGTVGARFSRWGRLVAVVAVGAMVFAGCGGDDDDDDPVATAIPAPATTATTAPDPGSEVVIDGDASPEATPRNRRGTPRAGRGAGRNQAGDATGGSEVAEAVVTLTDYRVNASQTTFKAGEPQTIRVQNNGETPHMFVIEAKGAVNEPLQADGQTARIDQIPPGEDATLTWTFAEPGEYQFACHMADHYELGMVLDSVTVSE